MFSRLFKGLVLLSLILFGTQAHAATCTTAQDGPWSTAATWTSCGGGVPGDGDYIDSIEHNVTLTGDATIGDDPAADTPVLYIASGGSLTIQAGVTLTLKGSLNVWEGTLTNNGTIDFLITTANQRILTGDNYHANCTVNIKGTSTSARAVVSNNASSTKVARLVGKPNNGSNEFWDVEFAEFDGLGSSTIDAFDSAANETLAAEVHQDDQVSFIDVIWDGCGRVFNTYDPNPNLDFIFQRNTFRNCTNSSGVCYRSTLNTDKGAGTGTWLFDNNVVEGLAHFYSGRDYTITNNLFYGDVDALATTGDSWAEFSGNLIRSTTGSGYTFPGSTTDNYFFLNNSSATNPHYFQTALNIATTHDGNIIEFDGADDQGDGFLIHAPGSSTTITLQNNLFLCGTSTNGIGTLFSALAGSNATIVANHNTWCVGSQGAAVGETYAGHSGMLSSFQSNIGWNQAASSGYLVYDSGADDSVSDLVSSSNFDYNVAYNLTGVENNLEFSSGTPNANGFTADPDFVDPTRNIADWDGSLGGAGTAANALTELLLRNDSSWDTNYNIADLVTYVKAGFAVQEATYEDAGHDAVTPGCCGFAAGSSPSPTPSVSPSTTPSASPSPSPSPSPGPVGKLRPLLGVG